MVGQGILFKFLDHVYTSWENIHSVNYSDTHTSEKQNSKFESMKPSIAHTCWKQDCLLPYVLLKALQSAGLDLLAIWLIIEKKEKKWRTLPEESLYHNLL